MANSIGLSDAVIQRYIVLLITAVATIILGFILSVIFGGAISWALYGQQLAEDGARTLSDLFKATVTPTSVIYPMGYGVGLLVGQALLRGRRLIYRHWLALACAVLLGSAALPAVIEIAGMLQGEQWL